MGNGNMISAVFSKVRRKFSEVKNDWSRKNPTPHCGVTEHNLTGYQVYPFGNNFFSCMGPAVEMEFKDLTVDLKTPVASLGSCFAEEFAYHMLSKGFNYIRTEKNRSSSANWGRVYTIPNLKQIVDYSHLPSYPVIIEKTSSRSNKQEKSGWFDPLRDRSPLHPDEETAKLEIQKHRHASLEVFRKAEILVIALGQNEGWRDKT
ncbi:MAG TPA: GSCFA domain-containing protein, partial [Candidatus Deferrimicrobium sp.]|nr:GSCFA domain-containing protein [Candidatus Deferrimicrobium sp.]